MDIDKVVQFLTPQLQYVLTLTQNPSISANIISTEKAKQIWQVLAPEIQQRDAAKTAVEKLVANPSAPDWQKVLRSQLQEIFTARPDLAAKVESIWQEEAALDSSTGHSHISVNGNKNQTIGSVSDNSRVFGNVGGSVDESQVKILADREGQIAGGNVTRYGSNFFSNNTVMLVIIVILALGGATWMLATRLSPEGVEIETQGGEQVEQPQNTTP